MTIEKWEVQSHPDIPHDDLAMWSRIAYKYADYEDNGTQAIKIDTPDYFGVAFRGTEKNFSDILRDIRGIPWRDKTVGWCHSGFVKGARRTFGTIYRDWARQAHKPIVMTGHSLGGALATVTACLFAEYVFDGTSITLVTFGSPRVQVGNQLTTILANANVTQTRYVHGSDCVPRHPYPVWPVPKIWHYQHISEGTLVGDLDGRFEDHQIDRYIEAVRQVVHQGKTPYRISLP